MLEKPNDLTDNSIIACLHNQYELQVVELRFLPLGADMNTAVYQAVDADEQTYFLKLRRGVFDTISVDVPKFLHDAGMTQIIPPIASRYGQLSSPLGEFNLLLSPFVEGQGGWDVNLSAGDWVEFGRALKQIHSAALPSSLAARIPREKYSPYWRERVRSFQEQIQVDVFVEPSAAALASLLKDKQPVVNHLIKRAEDLGAVLQASPQQEVLCHSDIHVGNLLITNDHRLYVVDWDQPILAPKERDLMFIGGGLGGGRHTPEQEETLFYRGYGHTEINPVALAYYRYERIVQDISAYCEQLLLTDEGGEDRPEGLRQITNQFQPGAVIDLAYRTEKQIPPELQTR